MNIERSYFTPHLTAREWRYVKKYRPISFTARYGSVEQYTKRDIGKEKLDNKN